MTSRTPGPQHRCQRISENQGLAWAHSRAEQARLIAGPAWEPAPSRSAGVRPEEAFHPRPSAAGTGYDASASSGSNLGPTSRKLADALRDRVTAYRLLHGLASDAPVPADAVTASGSGLDPHISVANAQIQRVRVARARALTVEQVQALVETYTEGREWGVLGEPGVNVLLLNRALDRALP